MSDDRTQRFDPEEGETTQRFDPAPNDQTQRYEETVQYGGGQAPPPGATQPLFLGEPPNGGRGRQVIAIVLALLIGLGGGFLLAQAFKGDDDLPDEDLVLFENASVAFPIEGAAFTASTFNEGTRECDKEQLKQFLRADPVRFEAWLELQGITEGEFDSFVDRLVTRILEEPTPVTNHGCFADGECPFELQSVLAAGTPVWFDPQQNRIVAKCLCSNPLKEPKCPPNCDPGEEPTPTPTETPTSSPTATPTQTRPPFTRAPTPIPTPTPTTAPTPTPVIPSPTPTLMPPN